MQDEIFRKSEGPRDRLTGGQPEGLPSLQVALGERMDLLRDRVREDADAERELRVDLPARLRVELAPVELEKPRPLDHVPRREFTETPQVLGGWLREDRDVLHLVIEFVFPADHAVPEPVRADGELDGHEWALRPVEEPREDRERLDRLRLLGDRDLECDGMEDVLDHFGPDEPREEVVDHGPLVMPADDPASLVEPPIGREARDRRRVDDPVVELQDPQGKPGDDQVLVVAGVPEQGPRLRVPREVVLAGLVVANQKMDAVLIVQERLVVRSAAVDGVEVEPRGAEVDERVRIVVSLELRRRIEGQVVVDELPEVGEACGDVRVVARRVLLSRRLGFDHLAGERLEILVVRQERRQVPKHAAEAAFKGRRSGDGTQASKFGAMERSGHVLAWCAGRDRLPGLTLCPPPRRIDYHGTERGRT